MKRIPWSYWMAAVSLAGICACAPLAPAPPANSEARQQVLGKLAVGIYGAAMFMGHALAPEEYARLDAVMAVWDAGGASPEGLAEAMYLELMRQISTDPGDERAWGELAPKEQKMILGLAALRWAP